MLKCSLHGPKLKWSRWFIFYSWCHQNLVSTVHYLCLLCKLLRGSPHLQLSGALLKSIYSAVQTAWRGFRIPCVSKRRGLAQPHQNTNYLEFVQYLNDNFKTTKVWSELFTVEVKMFKMTFLFLFCSGYDNLYPFSAPCCCLYCAVMLCFSRCVPGRG